MLKAECKHYAEQTVATMAPQSAVCQACGLEHDRHLRVCDTCGFVGCCESEQSHDTIHWSETGHAIIRRLPLDENSFTYCYECKEYLT